MKTILSAVLPVMILIVAGCDQRSATMSSPGGIEDALGKTVITPIATAAPTAQQGNIQTISWDNLLPADFQPDQLLKDYDVNNLSDDSPKAKELMGKLQAMWKEAPVVTALDGKTIRMPGFVVPLEGDGQVVNEFLLVPYYGACIHVPPPPANQIVYVKAQGRNVQVRRLFDTVWVTGVMKVEHTASDLGEAGYTLSALDVQPYDDPQQ